MQNLALPLVLAIPFGAFYSLNSGVERPHLIFGHEPLSKYAVFCLCEFGLFVLAIVNLYWRNGLFWVCVATLVSIPLIVMGSSNDFCMRVSIPALLVLFLFVCRTLLNRQVHKAQRLALLALLIVGMATPFQEIYRSAAHRGQVSDNIRTFDQKPPPGLVGQKFVNFVSKDPAGTPYMTYLSPVKPLPKQ